MNELALFAGAGGGLLGSILSGFRTVCAVEAEPYCREVMLRRQRDGLLPLFPIWDDVRTFDGRPWSELVDVITAGFPCQPFSVAGRRRAAADDRNLWPDTIRILRDVRPQYALLENVPGLVSGSHNYFATILSDLAQAGFNAEWGVLSAAGAGAPHIRKRLWILAYPTSHGREPRGAGNTQKEPGGRELDRSSLNANVSNSHVPRLEIRQEQVLLEQLPPSERSNSPGDFWSTEPSVGRVADGVAHRVDRLRALGNGQVPAVALSAFLRLRSRL